MKNRISYKKTICIIIIAVLLIFTANVYATNDSFKTSLSVDNSSIRRGENVTVTIALRDIAIESGEKGIGAYTAKIDFDSSVLEYVSTNGTDKWEAPAYQDTRIVGNTNDGKVVQTAQNIGTITFKVKENAKLGETTIKLTNFSGSTAETDVNAEDSSIIIKIVDKNTGGSGNGNTGGSGNGNTGESGNGNTGESGNSNLRKWWNK